MEKYAPPHFYTCVHLSIYEPNDNNFLLDSKILITCI